MAKRKTVSPRKTAKRTATATRKKPARAKPGPKTMTAPEGTSTIAFEKAATSPNFVRITVEDTDEALMPGATKGESQPYPIGTSVVAFIEVAGNPGDTATVNVKRATPAQIQLSTGSKAQNNAVRRLRVTG